MQEDNEMNIQANQESSQAILERDQKLQQNKEEMDKLLKRIQELEELQQAQGDQNEVV